MLELKRQHAQGSIILITHDLAVVAETCDRVMVMYGGKLQETGTVDQIFNDPRHPYTKGLLDSLPSQQHKPKERLHAIPGNVPSIMDLPEGCKFCTRCEEVLPVCESTEPPMYDLGNGHLVRCHLMEDAVK
jgi:peptide/nickel transport system ATP-binding protein